MFFIPLRAEITHCKVGAHAGPILFLVGEGFPGIDLQRSRINKTICHGLLQFRPGHRQHMGILIQYSLKIALYTVAEHRLIIGIVTLSSV